MMSRYKVMEVKTFGGANGDTCPKTIAAARYKDAAAALAGIVGAAHHETLSVCFHGRCRMPSGRRPLSSVPCEHYVAYDQLGHAVLSLILSRGAPIRKQPRSPVSSTKKES